MHEKRINIIEFHEQVNRPLILDGAIGSLLQQRNVEMHKTLWSSYANIAAPEKVIELHREYINAGADIITTNTFRTNPTAYNKVSLKISNYEFVKRSIELAKEAVGKNKNIIIAGSNPPCGDSYTKFRKVSQDEIERNHKNHIDMLWDSGVDFVLNETQSHFDEIDIICKHCSENDIPFIMSLFVTTKGKLLSGETLEDALKIIEEYNPIAVGLNCIFPKTFCKIVKTFETPMRWGFYLNCGSGKLKDAEIFEGLSPSDYINIINKKYSKEPFFVGSCCGSSPEHTKAIKEFLIGNN
ncbi:MAG: homocysteine S-methyltransferase family protein [Melioribacteraceae bacterium]|nr:homocysteine S-methyltransferase family protein [Melioribacteraceae bacterium]